MEKVVRRPSLTLVGMSTPSEFMKAIGGGDVASGLLNRFLIVKTDIGVQLSQEITTSTISERLKAWASDHAYAVNGTLDPGSTHDVPPSPMEVSIHTRGQGDPDGATRSVWSMPLGQRQALGWRPCTIDPERSPCACH